MASLLLAPYLPVTDACEVGPWRLVPFGEVEDSSKFVPEWRDKVRRLVEAYRLPAGRGRVGVVVHEKDGRIGDDFTRGRMAPLRQALLAGVVAGNPQMAVPDEQKSLNAGHGACTAENALLYGHPLVPGNTYVVPIGALVTTLSAHTAFEGEPLPKISPPLELPSSLFSSFDEELASAIHSLIVQEDGSGRRLAATLDWCQVALSNSDAVTPEVRVGAVRSALEVLTNSTETRKVVRSYGALVKTDATSSRRIAAVDVPWSKGDTGQVELTEDEWWLTRFTSLRNHIVHGVDGSLWSHEGVPQLDHAHDRLIAALRFYAARHAGEPLLLQPQVQRFLRRANEEVLRRIREESDAPNLEPE